ncbi:hypothetical protein [Actinomycetospora straminea]|uniref:Uncharacterized protein n=1 Tax=Actinomycetospora straminea TaxID=663607 RepID=A0ABP9EXU2_9PSEU|nr:hypothetical protein [Actinomycetospora straminea]MDD7933036.1 hypothetical protein [Actinomycetospora straminea]
MTLGHGQAVAEVVAVRDQIAAAFGVTGVGLTELPGRRLEIALRPEVPADPPTLVGVPTEDGVA